MVNTFKGWGKIHGHVDHGAEITAEPKTLSYKYPIFKENEGLLHFWVYFFFKINLQYNFKNKMRIKISQLDKL